MGRLQNKVAFLAGATSGIGRATALRFAAEGAVVVVTGRREIEGHAVAEEIRAGGGEATFLRMEVSSEADVVAAVRATVAKHGRLDILFNNAGGSSARDGKVTEVPLDEFWRVIQVDLLGTFLCCRHAIPELIKSGGGSVINNASMAGVQGGIGRDAYTCAKGGVIALTRSMSVEFAADKVRVNAIAPGGVKTERIVALLEASADARNSAAMQPLGLASTEDVAAAAVYLASDESKTTTGEILCISGGR